MTASELKTKIISSEKFLPRFVYSEIKTKNSDKTEGELCDCLLEFKNAYILIQIKEKEEGAEASFENWFLRKVITKAKNQVKDSIRQLNDSNCSFFSNNIPLKFDLNKQIKYVIVFDTDKIDNDYTKYYVTSSGIEINIFSMDDFEKMLDNLVLPSDIFDFLDFRRRFYDNKDIKNSRLIIDNISPNVSLFGKIGSDIQVSDYFIIKRYVEKGLNVEAVSYFNHIVKCLDSEVGDNTETLELLLTFNRNEAIEFTKLWLNAIDNCKKENFVLPNVLHDASNVLVCFAKPLKCDSKIYLYNFNSIIEECFEEYKCSKIHFFEFEQYSNEQCIITSRLITKNQDTN